MAVKKSAKPKLEPRSKEAKDKLQKVTKMNQTEKFKALLDAVSVIDNLPKPQRSAVMLGFLAAADLYQVDLAAIVHAPVENVDKSQVGAARALTVPVTTAAPVFLGRADPVW